MPTSIPVLGALELTNWYTSPTRCPSRDVGGSQRVPAALWSAARARAGPGLSTSELRSRPSRARRPGREGEQSCRRLRGSRQPGTALGSSASPRPESSTAAAPANWSVDRGRRSNGTPAVRASVTLLLPPCETASAAAAEQRDLGQHVAHEPGVRHRAQARPAAWSRSPARRGRRARAAPRPPAPARRRGRRGSFPGSRRRPAGRSRRAMRRPRRRARSLAHRGAEEGMRRAEPRSAPAGAARPGS